MEKTALIATLPKSGTWYSKIFFWHYEQLLQNADAYLKGEFRAELKSALYSLRNFSESKDAHVLGLDRLYVAHSICPGFQGLEEELLYQQWQALQFPITGYNGGEWHIRDLGKWNALNPAINPNAKIVYLYRNPLDHFVSYYNHVQNHIDKQNQFKLVVGGAAAPMNNLRDFIFNGNGLSGFIKHYYSFTQMKKKYPGQILMMPYEQLTTDPQGSFQAILSFMGAPVDTTLKQQLFEAALAFSSKTSLREFESNTGMSLAGDQGAGGRHIRDGSIGKWKEHIPDDDIEAIESALNLFEFTLNDFTLTDGIESKPLPWLAGIDKARKQEHQIEFLQQQLALAGAGIKTELTNIILSRSWRITMPLRVASRFARKAKAMSNDVFYKIRRAA